MLNVQTLGILLRALRDGNARPDALRAPGAVAGVARVTPVASDANESLRGDAAVRVLPALRPFISASADDAELPSHPRSATQSSSDMRIAAREPQTPASLSAPLAASRGTEGGASAALALSPIGRWLTEVQSRSPAAAGHATRTLSAPLAADANVSAPVLAQALANAVATSGVFYEAHLARWLRDDYPMSALAREPQAGWTSDLQTLSVPSAAPSLQDADKLALVTRQLETLDTKMLVWSGAPWPGQQATIEIREDEQRAAADAGDETHEPAWRTRISLALPALGMVEATIALRGDRLELRLTAGEHAGARLAAARDELGAALGARSLTLAGFAIGEGEGHER